MLPEIVPTLTYSFTIKVINNYSDLIVIGVVDKQRIGEQYSAGTQQAVGYRADKRKFPDGVK